MNYVSRTIFWYSISILLRKIAIENNILTIVHELAKILPFKNEQLNHHIIWLLFKINK